MSGPVRHEHSHPGTSDASAPGKSKMRLSIWFFVGALCLVYGVVLLPVGIYQLSHPPAVVLPELHATLWWSLLLTIFGAFYTIKFRPGKV